MSPEYAKEWTEKAEQDYRTVLVLSRQRKHKLPDVICFHAQQCAEKYLKALMAKHKLKIPRSHDLEYLAGQLKEKEPFLNLTKDICLVSKICG